MEDVTLSWPGKMTTEQAKKYLMTAGFVAVELYREVMKTASQQATPADEIPLSEILECPSCHATGQAEVFRR